MRKPVTVKADRLRLNRNRPPDGEPWIWFSRQLMESDAWRTQPLNTRRVVERIEIEHMMHAGTANGRLVVTYKDFEKWGIRRESIPGAIEDARKRGLIYVRRGGRCYGLSAARTLTGLAGFRITTGPLPLTGGPGGLLSLSGGLLTPNM